MEWASLNGSVTGLDTQNTQTGTSGYNTITMGASNAKGDYFLIAPGVDYNANGVLLGFIGDQTRDVLMDVLSTSGSVSGMIVSDLYLSLSTNFAVYVYLPITIPANTSLFGRGQISAINTDQTMEVSVTFYRQGWMNLEGFDRITTYGADLSASKGSVVDPGASANTWGSWTTLASGTSYSMDSILILLGDNDSSTVTFAPYLFEIGVGSVGNEVPIFRGMFVANANDDAQYPIVFGPLPLMIPENSRVSIRAQTTITSSPARLFAAAIYGFD